MAADPLRVMSPAWPRWPQLSEVDSLRLGTADDSKRSATLRSRTENPETVVCSGRPYCAVSFRQLFYVKQGEVTRRATGSVERAALPAEQAQMVVGGATASHALANDVRLVPVTSPTDRRWP